jgi:hypothetical protein
MKCAAAPFLGSNIGDGFGEVPVVAMKILSVVLALAIGLVLGFAQNNRTIPPRAIAMSVGIFNPNLNDVRVVGCHTAFRYRKAALSSVHLDTVIRNAETNGEPKSLRQPIRRCRGIRVDEHRNHGARWNRSVESHLETLALNQSNLSAGKFTVVTESHGGIPFSALVPPGPSAFDLPSRPT